MWCLCLILVLLLAVAAILCRRRRDVPEPSPVPMPPDTDTEEEHSDEEPPEVVWEADRCEYCEVFVGHRQHHWPLCYDCWREDKL